MNHTQPTPAARLFCDTLKWLSALVLVAALPAIVHAQGSTGTLTGHVYNQATNEYLPGVDIHVVGTNITVQSTSGGVFDIPNLPAGPVTLEAAYTNLDTQTVTVTVVAGTRTSEEIPLTSKRMYGDTIKLNQFVVAGELEGEAKAITVQKHAPNMVDVVDADQFPNIAGGSIGNFLQNLPGIAIGYSVADPRTISVRGMDPSMNSVTVNGMRASSASSGNANRQFEIDQISMQDIASVEVYRTALPSQDADSGGGTINLVSRNAFDQKGEHAGYAINFNGDNDVYSLHGGLTNDGPDRASQIRPGANAFYSNSFFNNRLGVVFTANDFEFYTISPSTKIGYTNISTLFANVGVNADPSSPTGEYINQFQIANGASFTRRHGVSLNVDFRLTDNTVIFANNQVNTSYIRSAGRGQSFTSTAPTTATATTTNSTAPGWTDESEVSRGDAVSNITTAATSSSTSLATLFSGDLLNKTGAGSTFSAGEKTHFDTNVGPWDINLTLSSALSTNQYDLGPQNPVGGATFYLRGITWALTNTPGGHYPVITQLAGPDFTNLSNYVSRAATASTSSLDGLTYANPQYGPVSINNTRESHATDRLDEIRYDVTHGFTNMSFPFDISAGFEVRHEYRDIDNNGRERYVYNGPAMNFGQFAETVFQKQNILAYASPAFPSLTAIQSFFQANPQDFTKDPIYEIQARDTGLRHLFEAVNGGYVMSNLKLTPKFNLMVGVRFEQTIEKVAGPIYNNNLGFGFTDPVAQANAVYGQEDAVRHPYQNWFPNIQARYNFTPNLLGRLSFNDQFARQQMGNLIPGASVSTATPYVVTANNPNLAPILYEDYDASLEYYMTNPAGAGKLTVDAYYKKIRNFTAAEEFPLVVGTNYNVGFNTDQYASTPGSTLVQLTNVGNARQVGSEIDYQQELGGISPILNGFSVYANYGYTFGETNAVYMGTTLVTPGQVPVATKFPIINQYPHQFNAGITYTRDPHFASIKMNYFSNEPTAFSTTATAYNLARTTCDIYYSYRFYKQNVVYVDARDVFNAPLVTYADVPYRTSSYTLFGSQWNVGIKGTF